MSEFVMTSIPEARRMVHWLARRRRTSVFSLVKAAQLPSQSLGTFARLDEATQKTRDTVVSGIMQLVNAHDHRLIARPAGAKHLQVEHAGGVPLEIRAAGGGLLEIPLTDMPSMRVFGHTMTVVNNCSLTAIANKAGVSMTFVSYVNNVANHKDVSLRVVLEMALAGGFELVVQPCFANKREARLAEKLGSTG